ncbi:hypothetical protein CHS0354_024886 [Potamilus streckersoni]|uniref:Uncharacterized protein n=1 Tax=Potamilus streckersoni TaxID=2493646 RepID=A0AAE0WBN9_9BIVA|nr:hypothetical protein CHS0354_024886 [Potamilus streckersoni]
MNRRTALMSEVYRLIAYHSLCEFSPLRTFNYKPVSHLEPVYIAPSRVFDLVRARHLEKKIITSSSKYKIMIESSGIKLPL